MQCTSPMSVARPGGLGNTDRITVPCGKCIECLKKRRKDWVFRMLQELKHANNAYFVTLTYAPEHLPTNNELSKTDVQAFLKRLRHLFPSGYSKVSPRFKYYVVGEYGTEFDRSHYHAIMFNLPPDLNHEKILNQAWNKGFVHASPDVNIKSISYTLGYIINEPTKEYEVTRPFAMMSLKPAIGFDYVEKMRKYHTKGRIFHGKMDGQNVGLPRYYRDKIFTKMDVDINLKKVQKVLDEKLMDEIDRYFNKGDNYFINKFEAEKQNEISIRSRNKKMKKL